MYSRTIEIYCFVDDLLKSINHKDDCRRQFSDAELVTTAFVAALFCGGNFRSAQTFLKQSGLMPRMLSPSRFSRRLHTAQALIERVFETFANRRKKQSDWQNVYLLDSFPVGICDNIRISRSRLVTGAAWRGWRASHRRYFYGVRVSVLTDAFGIPVEMVILPGNCSDISGLAQLPLDLAAGSRIIADAGYTFYDWEDDLREQHSINILVQRKTNSKRRDVPSLHDYKSVMRKRIETTFSEITSLCGRKVHSTSLSGFILKVALFVIAFAVNKAIALN